MALPSEPGAYYLGQPGHLIGLDGAHASLTRGWSPKVEIVEGGLAPSYAVTSLRRPARSWKIGLDNVTPEQVAGVHELLALVGAPIMLVDPWAQVTNVLTVEASLCAGMERVGGFDLEGGGHTASAVVVQGVTSSDQGIWEVGAGPVLPGRPHTVSAYVGGPYAARIGLSWRDATGEGIGLEWGSVVPASTSRLRRGWCTATPPTGAVGAGVVTIGARYVARAASTWTEDLTEWGVGGLAPVCFITEASDDPSHAVPGVGGLRRMGFSLSVDEIGV